MGHKFEVWHSRSSRSPKNDYQVAELIRNNRCFEEVDKLDYGDHGLEAAREAIKDAIQSAKRIALYADYDGDWNVKETSNDPFGDIYTYKKVSIGSSPNASNDS